jgi:hypothetical protein
MQLRVVWSRLLIGYTEGPALIAGTAWLTVSNCFAFLAHRQLPCPDRIVDAGQGAEEYIFSNNDFGSLTELLSGRPPRTSPKLGPTRWSSNT